MPEVIEYMNVKLSEYKKQETKLKETITQKQKELNGLKNELSRVIFDNSINKQTIVNQLNKIKYLEDFNTVT